MHKMKNKTIGWFLHNGGIDFQWIVKFHKISSRKLRKAAFGKIDTCMRNPMHVETSSTHNN